jgi:hypothetical protein
MAMATISATERSAQFEKFIAIATGLLLLTASVAFGAARTVGQTIVYDFNESIRSTPSVPAGMSPENRAKMERAQNKPQSFVLTVTLEEIAPDGSAHVKASLVDTASASAPASLRNASSDFIATLTQDGQIIAQYDPKLQPTTGAGGRLANLAEVNLNNAGGQVMTHFPYFNAFAKGCAMRPRVATWHEIMPDSLGGQRTFTFATTGARTVTMTNNFENQYMVQTIRASGHCDASAGLVLDYHEEIDNTPKNGSPSSITRDIKLRQ